MSGISGSLYLPYQTMQEIEKFSKVFFYVAKASNSFITFIMYFFLQNSRDNMSVILVTFPGAPKVSQEAIKKVRKAYENNLKFLSKCVLVRSEKTTYSRCFLQDRKR